MQTLVQRHFEEPPETSELSEEPLVIHCRSEGVANRVLVIFVHGLGGSRYGKEATWGKFPEFVYEDFPELDVGLYEYRTFYKRFWKFLESVKFETEAQIFAEIIRDLKNYTTIILVGHSMGGLLCKATLSHFVTTSQTEILSRVGGLFLMATPQMGSQRVQKLFSWFSKDLNSLIPHGELVTRIDTIFSNAINCNENADSVVKVAIPTWAILSASDLWVDKLSAGIGIPAPQIKTVRGSHTDIVKPRNKQTDVYLFVRDRIKKCRDNPNLMLASNPLQTLQLILPETSKPLIAEERISPGDISSFHNLGLDRFKDLCSDLLVRQQGIATCDIYEPQGREEYGVDLLARRYVGGEKEVGRCRCDEKCSSEEIEDASDRFFLRLEYWKNQGVVRFILFLACDLNDPQQQEEIDRQTERFAEHGIVYEAWSAKKIRLELAPHRDIVFRATQSQDWVDQICGPYPQHVPSHLGDRSNFSLPLGFSSNSLIHLGSGLSKGVEARLENIRESYREGQRREAYAALKELQSEEGWDLLEKSLQARILRMIATYTLNVETDIPIANDLATKARERDPDGDDSILRTLLKYYEEGVESALEEIGTPHTTDVFNLRIFLLFELGRAEDAYSSLKSLPQGIEGDIETQRLHSLALMIRGDFSGAQIQIQQAHAEQPKWESIRFTRAIISYFSALSPSILPIQPFAWPEPVNWTFIKRDDQSLQGLRDAETEFESLMLNSDQNDNLNKEFCIWRLACLANDPDRQNKAEQFCQELLSIDPTNHRITAWALARNYTVDLSAIEEALETSIEEDEDELL